MFFYAQTRKINTLRRMQHVPAFVLAHAAFLLYAISKHIYRNPNKSPSVCLVKATICLVNVAAMQFTKINCKE